MMKRTAVSLTMALIVALCTLMAPLSAGATALYEEYADLIGCMEIVN